MIEKLKLKIEKDGVVLGHIDIELETERMSAEVQMKAECGQDIREMLKAIDVMQAVFSGQISHVRSLDIEPALGVN